MTKKCKDLRFVKMVLLSIVIVGVLLFNGIQVSAANPYLPIWERIPDGEPKVFSHNGEERVYIYGSHDNTNDRAHCGDDHVVWSAPVDDLNNWRHEGVAFDVTWLDGVSYTTYDADGNVDKTGTIQLDSKRQLYAPDVVYNPNLGKYYLYTFITNGTPEPNNLLFVASSDSPTGPFSDPVHIPVGYGKYGGNMLSMFGMGGGFDPGVYVDTENLDNSGYPTVYLYWGIMMQGVCQLDGSDMSTIIEGSVKEASTTGNGGLVWGSGDSNGVNVPTSFFEASSPRKIDDFYVMVYAANNSDGNGYSSLAYVYGTDPIGYGDTWNYGGVIVDNRGEVVKNPYDSNEDIWSYQINNGENNHGSLAEINGQWYIFYHRHTQNGRSARQAMAEPVNISTDNGKLVIEQAEVTSQGFETNGLNPYEEQNAGITSYVIGENIWIQTHTYDIDDWDPNSSNPNMDWNPISSIENQNWVGYKYFDFGTGTSDDDILRLSLTLTEKLAGTINVYAAEPRANNAAAEQPKTLIGTLSLNGNDENVHTVETTIDSLTGKKAIYFEFLSDEAGEICQVNKLQFIKTDAWSKLSKLIEDSSELSEKDYLADTWLDFEEALTNAKEVYNNIDSKQSEIDGAIENLNIAIAALEKLGDKTTLIDEIESEDYKEADYTKLSWSIYKDALNVALEVAKDDEATQGQVDKALNDLISAKEGLKKKPATESVDKSLLNETLEKANHEEKNYTAESWADYKKALDSAKKVNANEKATQPEVDKAEKELLDAISSLKRTPMKYKDVIKGEWYYGDVEYVHNNLLMTGLNDTLFGVNEPLSRAQVAVILYRMEGEPTVSYTNKFPDVAKDEWYSKAVIWANEAGIVTGYIDTGKFVPAGNISRQELATMIYRYADYRGMDITQKSSLTKFKDNGSVAAYALDPMKWVVRNKIITGKDNETRLDPTGTATRAESAAIIHRFLTGNN